MQDANGKYLADKISLFGLDLKFMMAAGDNQADMFAAFDFLAGYSDAIVVSGGLGLTPDDLTIEVFAQYAGVNLEFHADVLQKIAARFKVRDISMPATNKKQAMTPAARKE